nr:reverse transcriptase domain-containing protein [Tanacetum cinerariifolium]
MGKQICNKDLRTELDYYIEESDEEREMEPKPTRVRKTTPVERESEGRRPLKRRTKDSGSRGVNLPSLLAAHLGRNKNGQPLQSTLTSVYGGHQPLTNSEGISLLTDYPLPDGLKMPSQVGSYDGKRDPDNYLHLFEGVISMQKWAMSVACHMFTYTLKDSARIWWNDQKTCSIVNYEDLKAKFKSHFSEHKKFKKTHLAKTKSLVEFLSMDHHTTYKGLMEKTYTWIEAKEITTNEVPNDHREDFNGFNEGSFLDNIKRKKKNKDTFVQEPKGNSSNEEGGKSLRTTSSSYKVKAARPCCKQNKERKDEGLIYSIRRIEEGRKGYCISRSPYPHGHNNSFDPVIIMVQYPKDKSIGHTWIVAAHTKSYMSIFFLKLKSSIKALRVYFKIPLVGLSGEHPWPLKEVPLEVTIGESPYTITKTLNFIIARSDSPHNLFLRRYAMQKIGIVVSTTHATIKFHTPYGYGTVSSTYESNKFEEGHKKVKETFPKVTKDVLSCVDTEDRIIVKD